MLPGGTFVYEASIECKVVNQNLWFNGYLILAAAAAAKSIQSCPTLCDPIDGSPPGFPIPGILQARTLEWVAISFSKCVKVKLLSHVRLSDPMDCSLPGSSIHGIFQARVLEWGAIAFSNIYIYKINIKEQGNKYFKYSPLWIIFILGTLHENLTLVISLSKVSRNNLFLLS